VGQGHHGHGGKSGGCNRTRPERGKEIGHRGCRSGCLDTRRLDADRGTEEAGGAQTAAAGKAAQIKAKTKPKAEPSTNTNTNTNANSKSRIDVERGDDISADTDPTMCDIPTVKPIEAGQPSPRPDNRVEHGRQTPNSKEKRERATPQ